MILRADSEIVRQTSRRKTGNGWHTTFIGQNRNTLKESDAVPESGVLYPMAFLVEKEAGAVTRPHFHQADQYQVVVAGTGKLGLHDVASVAVHYTDPFSAYGPIVAAEEGIHWFTLRNCWDPGARYMPAERQALRAARGSYQHGEATVEPMPVPSAAELVAAATVSCLPLIEESADGLGTWRYRLPPGAAVQGPDPAKGGGQFWLVLAGTMAAGDPALLPPNSCIFVAPTDGPLAATAGPQGAEALCMQFRNRVQH